MKKSTKSDEIALAAYIWHSNGQTYLYGLNKSEWRWSSSTSPYYPVNEKTAHLRLKDLLQRGWAEPAGESRSPWTKGEARKLYRLTHKGQDEFMALLRERFAELDVLEARSLFFTCLKLLWGVASWPFIAELISIRIGALAKPGVKLAAGAADIRMYPDALAVAVTNTTLRVERNQLKKLKDLLESPDFEAQAAKAFAAGSWTIGGAEN